MSEVILESTLTCPSCGHAKTETMPTDACQWLYECAQCLTALNPSPGDCCVYCSYGTVPCPPIQEGSKCGGGRAALPGNAAPDPSLQLEK